MGVGVLRDDGGDDAYTSEALSQGAAMWGLGILSDGGGTDTYRAWSYAQGFAYVGAGGLLYDVDGNDVYWADPGRDYGGTTLYASPQLANGEGNSSLSQGAGFGMRQDSYGVYLSGGLALLRDAAGDDIYTAAVFGQGTGYWEGTGILADLDGSDAYDAVWYIQGGAAHYAMGILVDGGGDDAYNQTFDSCCMQTGAGHDYSLGVFVDEAGDDVYGYGSLAVGASNCQGFGVFVDNDGSDAYLARSTYSTGLGNHSSECDSRLGWNSVGIFMDAGGDPDTYSWPDDTARLPADDSSFGYSWNGTDDEFGGAVDGDGETNFHAR
jgi:hypothetical protein